MAKGQLSIFLIGALILVGVISLYIILAIESPELRLFPAKNHLPLQTHVNLCEDRAVEGLLLRLGLSSGKFHFSPGTLPDFVQMERDAGRYVQNSAAECFTFEQFNGTKVTVNKLSADVHFDQDQTQASFKNDMESEDKDELTQLADHITKIPISIQKIYDEALSIRKKPKFQNIPENYFTFDDTQFSLEVAFINESYVFSLIDDEHAIKQEKYRFYFIK